MNKSLPNNFPENLRDSIAPGQYATVSRLIDNYDVPANIYAGSGMWFAPPMAAAVPVQPKEPPIYRIFDVVFKPAPEYSKECVGSVVLSWDVLKKESLAWMDIAFVLRFENVWYPVFLDIDEYEDRFDQEHGCPEDNVGRVWLTVDPLKIPCGIDRLRGAFPRALWVCQRAGLGLFVAGAVDVD